MTQLTPGVDLPYVLEAADAMSVAAVQPGQSRSVIVMAALAGDIAGNSVKYTLLMEQDLALSQPLEAMSTFE